MIGRALPGLPQGASSIADAARHGRAAANYLGSSFRIGASRRPFATVAQADDAPPRPLHSLQAAFDYHDRARSEGRYVKSWFTNDSKTLDVAAQILDGNRNQAFLSEMLLTPPSDAVDALGSKPVKFSRLADQSPAIQEAYRNRAGQVSLLCVGGPASVDCAVLARLIFSGQLSLPLQDIAYLVDDFRDSNLISSAHQLHARHGTALNADAHLTGHALIAHFLWRAAFGTTLAECKDPDFRKIDLPLSSLTPRKLMLYAANEANWLRQAVRQRMGKITEHDLNRMESVLSRETLRVTEKLSGLELSSNAGRDSMESVAIHVDLTAQGRKETLHEMEELARRVGIGSQSLSAQELSDFFGPQAPNIVGATRYFSDGAFKIEGQKMLVDWLVGQGASYRGERITDVLFVQDDKSGKAKVAGVITADNDYIYASHVKLSLGYMASFEFAGPAGHGLRGAVNSAKSLLGLSSPVPGHRLTTATGASVTAVFHLDPGLRRLIDQHGSLPQYAVTNSHWTLIAAKGDKALVRITGGGTTGVEVYNPAYFLNLVKNTERIFGPDALVGIVSTYGCPRSLNGRNSSEFQIAGNVAISYGKGGTGNTKRHAEALMSLCMLFPQFKQGMLAFLDSHVAESGQPLGRALAEIHDWAHEMGFIDDEQSNLDRGLGFDRSFSEGELLMFAVLLLVTTVGAGLLVRSASDDRKQPNPPSDPSLQR